ncbi:MAG: autotransporter-associated beta strand repeat-containing protein, partial [Verrucomicrobiota bacterium]
MKNHLYILALLGFASFLTSIANGQTTYNNNTANDNNNPSRWEESPGTGGANWDQTVSPGSVLNGTGALDDRVFLKNFKDVSTGLQQRMRTFTNIGTIGELVIGGEGMDPATGTNTNAFTGNMQLQMRNGSSLTVTGPFILGQVGPFSTGQRAGQVNMNNGTSSLTVQNVVSGSTAGANLLQPDAGSPTLTINGDIDTSAARAAAGVTPAGDDFEIDLRTNVGTNRIVWGGSGGQIFNLENFDVGNTGSTGRTISQTLPAGNTVNALIVEVGRISSTNGSNRTVNATLNVEGNLNTTTELKLANTASDEGAHTTNGTLNVNAGAVVNVGTELRFAPLNTDPGLSTSNDNGTGVANINGGTTVVNAGLEMGSQDSGGTTSATLNVLGGTISVNSEIQDSANGSSAINVNGGELILLDAEGGPRDVDDLDHETGTIDFLLYAGMPDLTTTNFEIGDGTPGSALYDLTLPVDAVSSTTDMAVFDNEAADMDWDNTLNWDMDLLPSNSGGLTGNGTVFTLVTSTNTIVANGGGAVVGDEAAIGNSDGGWTLSQNANDISVTRTGGAYGAGPAKAVVNTSVTVNRGTSLNIQNSGGEGADASALDLGNDAILNVTGDLVLGGNSATGDVDQTGTSDLNVSGDLLFGGPGGSFGGVYNLDGGTLDVTGDVTEDTDAVDTAQLHIDGGTLSVTGGDITVQRFSVGEKASTSGSHTMTAGQTITTTGEFTVGENGTGVFTATDATIVVGGAVLANGDGADGDGTMTLNGATTVTANNGNLEVAGNGTGTTTLNGSSSITNGGGTFRVADIGTGVLNMNGSSTIVQSGGNLETAQNSTSDGTVNMDTTGGITLNSNNFILGQSANATAELNLTNGTINTLGSGGTHNGLFNINSGDGTVTMTGGTIRTHDLQLSNNAAGSTVWVQSGGSLLVDDDVEYRDNGVDSMEFSGNAIVRTGQDSIDAQDGRFQMSVASTSGVGGNLLTIKGSNVTIEVDDDFNADANATVAWEFDDTTVSSIVVNDAVNINGAFAAFTHSGTTPPSTGEHILIDKVSAGPVSGTFDGLGQGATVDVAGQTYQISYVGGDGNDVTLAPLTDPVVTIVSDGDIIEGSIAGFTVTSNPAPSGGNIDMTIVLSGTSSAGVDYTDVMVLSILDGTTIADLDVITSGDSDFEGCETLTATILLAGTGVTATLGDPSSATITIFDGNNPPAASAEIDQAIISADTTVALGDIVITDPDADYQSLVSASTVPIYHYSGQSNVSTFFDGRPDDDSSFDLDAAGPALVELSGFSLEVDFIAQAGDIAGTTLVWELGGTSNGSSLLLREGIPHLLMKCNGGSPDFPTDDETVPGVFTDLDWGNAEGADPAGNGQDDTVVVPLGTTAVTPGLPTRIAVIYDILNDTVRYSVNGGTEGTATLLNRDGNNWRGDHSTNHGTGAGGGVGGTNNNATSAFRSDVTKNLVSGFAAYSCARFWNEAGTVSPTSGSEDSVTATLTVVGGTGQGTLAATASGAAIVGGSGTDVVTITGNAADVTATLASVEFVAGGSVSYPVSINVSIDDGDEDGGGPETGLIIIDNTPPDPIYVDDDFVGTIGSTVADADDGTGGAEAGTIGLNAFQTLAEALAIATTNTTIIINDGTYAETPTLSDAQVLQLTGSGGSAGGSTVTIDSLSSGSGNTIALDSNDIVLGNNAGDNIIDGVISGTGSLEKVGTDRLVLRNDNTYTGTTTITEGFLRLGFVGAQRGTLQSSEIITTAPGILELNVQVDTTYTHSILISGTGEVRTLDNGTVEFDGPANTFTGEFHLGDGTSSFFNGIDGAKEGFVVVNNNDHLGAGTIRSRGGQLQAGTASLDIPNPVLVEGGGLRMGGTIDFELSGAIEVIGATRGFSNLGLDGLDITLSGDIDLAEGTNSRSINFEGAGDKDNGNFIVTGNISGTAGSSIQLQNSLDEAILTISGTNTYPGSTTLSNGAPESTIVFNGSHTGAGDYNIDGGTLEGTGTTDGNVNIDGDATVSPGSGGPGTLTTGNLDIEGTFVGDIDGTGTVAGTDFDQIVVTGTVDVDGATFDLSSSVVLSAGTYVLVANDAADATTGTPVLATGVGAGLLPGGSTGVLEIGGLTTTGGDGNDVAIGLSEIPADDDTGDSDGLGALLELAFGTDYLVNDNNPLVVVDPMTFTPGTQITDLTFGPLDFDGRFVRRVDHASIGLTYTPQFSHDMSVWVDATDT